MEYVKVIYPTRRMVYIDGEQNGYTNEVLRVEAGAHVFKLGGVLNFEPSFRRVTVKDTTVLEPLEIVFRPKEDE
jgi:hypothetical protein